MEQSHHKSPKVSNELEKKSHHFSEAQVSVLKMERTHPLLGRTASADSLPPPQSFPARPSQGLPRPRGPLPRDAGGVGAAPSFQEHSPEVTLGEAKYCPVAKQKNHSAEGGAPPPPARGQRARFYLELGPTASTYPWLPALLPRRAATPLLPSQASGPASPLPPAATGPGGGAAHTAPPPPSRPGLPRSCRVLGSGGGGGGPRLPPPLPPRPPATAPLFRRPIGCLLD